MNDAIRPVLRDLVQREGAAVYEDPRRCEALLRDLAGEHRSEIFVLVTAVRAGVATDLLAASAGFEEETAARLATRLSDEYGMDQDASRWAVDAWAEAVDRGTAPAAGPAPSPPDEDATRTAGRRRGAAAGAAGAAAGAAAGGLAGAAPAAAAGGPPGAPPGPPPGPGGPPPGPPPGPGGPGGPQRDDRRRRRLIPIIALIAIAALITGVVVALSSGKSASADEILAEPAVSDGQNPFTASVAGALLPTVPSITLPTLPPTPTTIAVSAPRAVPGGQVGLYGGTRDNSSCNARRMLDFLNSNADKARAWAAAEGIQASQIPSFLAQLTPAVLRADTLVTNHGFRNGRANPIRSVLQAGTAVLVDKFGVPRARCACGNPLKPAAPVTTKSRYTGPRWSGFNPGNVYVVNQNTTIINNFTFVDVHNGQPFQQPAGLPGLATPTPGGGSTTVPSSTTLFTVPPNVTLTSGDVQVTLLWNGRDDLDVHAIDPSGEEIYFQHPTAASRGKLDHDDTAGCSTGGGTHVEHIFWPRGGAPPGAYQAFVKDYTSCGAPQQYELRVESGTQVVSDTSGTFTTEGQQSAPIRFQR